MAKQQASILHTFIIRAKKTSEPTRNYQNTQPAQQKKSFYSHARDECSTAKAERRKHTTHERVGHPQPGDERHMDCHSITTCFHWMECNRGWEPCARDLPWPSRGRGAQCDFCFAVLQYSYKSGGDFWLGGVLCVSTHQQLENQTLRERASVMKHKKKAVLVPVRGADDEQCSIRAQ